MVYLTWPFLSSSKSIANALNKTGHSMLDFVAVFPKLEDSKEDSSTFNFISLSLSRLSIDMNIGA